MKQRDPFNDHSVQCASESTRTFNLYNRFNNFFIRGFPIFFT